MPVRYSIDPTLNLMYFLVYGRVSAQDLAEIERRLATDPLRRPEMLSIADMLYVQELSFEVTDIRRWVEHLGQLTKSGSESDEAGLMIAILWESSFAETFSQMLMLMALDFTIGVKSFTLLEEALTWMKLTEAQERILAIRSQLLQEAAPNHKR